MQDEQLGSEKHFLAHFLFNLNAIYPFLIFFFARSMRHECFDCVSKDPIAFPLRSCKSRYLTNVEELGSVG